MGRKNKHVVAKEESRVCSSDEDPEAERDAPKKESFVLIKDLYILNGSQMHRILSSMRCPTNKTTSVYYSFI
jgi:hypothetical protein